LGLGFGVLGFGVWGLGPIPNPHLKLNNFIFKKYSFIIKNLIINIYKINF